MNGKSPNNATLAGAITRLAPLVARDPLQVLPVEDVVSELGAGTVRAPPADAVRSGSGQSTHARSS